MKDRNLVDCIEEIFEEMKNNYQCFIVTNDEIQISKDRFKYSIQWDRLNSEKQLLNWVIHLIGKKWITKELLRAFIEIVNEYQDLKLQVNFYPLQNFFSSK